MGAPRRLASLALEHAGTAACGPPLRCPQTPEALACHQRRGLSTFSRRFAETGFGKLPPSCSAGMLSVRHLPGSAPQSAAVPPSACPGMARQPGLSAAQSLVYRRRSGTHVRWASARNGAVLDRLPRLAGSCEWCIDAVVCIEKYVFAPHSLDDLLTRYKFSPALDEQEQQFHRDPAQTHRLIALPQLYRIQIQLKFLPELQQRREHLFFFRQHWTPSEIKISHFSCPSAASKSWISQFLSAS